MTTNREQVARWLGWQKLHIGWRDPDGVICRQLPLNDALFLAAIKRELERRVRMIAVLSCPLADNDLHKSLISRHRKLKGLKNYG